MGCECFKIVKLNTLRTCDPSMLKYGALFAVDFFVSVKYFRLVVVALGKCHV